jgi:3-phenylpropionate/trans-cinnamate dioxygenase ferredoxin subunit
MSRQIVVGAVAELAPGERKLTFVEGRGIVLFNIDGSIHAIENSCPHNGASLASGKLDGCVLRCPAHGLRFDLRTGCMPGVEGLSVTTFPVTTVDSKLVVSLDEPDTPAHDTDSLTQTAAGCARR